MESKNLKTVRKNVGMKLINKSNRITSAAFDSFQHTIENGNRSSIRKINDMLDSLGDQAGKKKITIKQFKEFNQQKGITVLVDNLDRPKTSAYFKLKGQIKDYDEGFSYVKSAIETKLKNILKVKRSMKTHLGIKITFAKKDTNSEGESIVEYEDKHFKTKPETISSDKQIISTVQKLKDDLKQMVAEVSLEGSQWSIVKIHFFFIECVSIRVSRGASYMPTPAPYNNAKCGLINIKNESNEY